MIFKKKKEEEPVEEIVEEEPVVLKPIEFRIPDVFDYAERYIEQLHSQERTGEISHEYHECEMDRIIKRCNDIKKLCETPPEDFNEQVHRVIESIFNERGKL